MNRMNKIKCDYCQSIITEFVSVNYIDYVTNKRVCEDRPFCSVCLEEDFEKTRVMGERASQIENGAQILISNPERFKNSYLIAQEEFDLKKIPFIIKRPYNNGFEYFKLEDLY